MSKHKCAQAYEVQRERGTTSRSGPNLFDLCLAFHARYIIASTGMVRREGRRSRRQGSAALAAPRLPAPAAATSIDDDQPARDRADVGWTECLFVKGNSFSGSFP